MRLIAALTVLLALAPVPAQTTQPAATAHKFVVGQKVEVKWGGAWRQATITTTRGDWTLVQYVPGRAREWVEPWRMRKLGSTEDNIPVAHPNPMVLHNE